MATEAATPFSSASSLERGAISPLMSSRSLMVSGVLLQRLARGVEGAVALLDGVLELLLALLLVELDPRLDGQLRGLDRPVVDGVALVVEAAQLVQAVLDLLRQQLVVGAEALGLGPVGGGCPVDRGPLPEQGRSPLPAAAVDVADREAALALELVDEGGESGGQAGEGGAAGGPVALGLLWRMPTRARTASTSRGPSTQTRSLVRMGKLRTSATNLAYGGGGRRLDAIVRVKTAATGDVPNFSWSDGLRRSGRGAAQAR
jgi:hypothetical protein